MLPFYININRLNKRTAKIAMTARPARRSNLRNFNEDFYIFRFIGQKCKF